MIMKLDVLILIFDIKSS